MSNQLVSDAKLSDALEYLATSAAPFAAAQSKAKVGERRAKAIRARAAVHYSNSPAVKSLGLAQEMAEASSPYNDALDDWEKAVHEATEIGAHRERARYLVEVWRSTQANARQGKL